MDLVNIPLIGLGVYKLDNEDTCNIVKQAISIGYRYIDTAQMFRNEKAVGMAIEQSLFPRQQLFICTKVQSIDVERGRAAIIKSIKKSLENLQTNYIDLLVIHKPVKDCIKESWKTLEDIYFDIIDGVRARYIGVCNYNIDDLNIILQNCKVIPHVNQIEYTPFLKRKNLAQYCKQYKIKIMAHTSLTKGVKLNNNILKGIAIKYDMTPAQVLITWYVAKNIVPIFKTKKWDHLIENYCAIQMKIDDEDINKLDNIGELFSCYPNLVSIYS